MVTVSAKDFGPIIRGTVDLKPLTIFMGRSNTGKSFMATAIYALMTALFEDEPALYSYGMGITGRHFWSLRRSFAFRALKYKQEAISLAMRDLLEWAGSQSVDDLDTDEFSVSDLPERVQELLESSIGEYLDSLGDNVIQRLVQTYGESSGFVRRGEEPRDPRLSIERDNPSLHLDIDLSAADGVFHEYDISDLKLRTSLLDDFPVDAHLGDENETILFQNVFNVFVSTLIEQTLIGLPQKSFYLPAARSGIAQGHKVLAASLVRQSRRIGLEPVNIRPPLPGIATEFLSHLDRRSRARPKQEGQVYGEQLTSLKMLEVLQGKVSLDNSGLPYLVMHTNEQWSYHCPSTFTLDYTFDPWFQVLAPWSYQSHLVDRSSLQLLQRARIPESHPKC